MVARRCQMEEARGASTSSQVFEGQDFVLGIQNRSDCLPCLTSLCRRNVEGGSRCYTAEAVVRNRCVDVDSGILCQGFEAIVLPKPRSAVQRMSELSTAPEAMGAVIEFWERAVHVPQCACARKPLAAHLELIRFPWYRTKPLFLACLCELSIKSQNSSCLWQ
jgi:hypothetical protein